MILKKLWIDGFKNLNNFEEWNDEQIGKFVIKK